MNTLRMLSCFISLSLLAPAKSGAYQTETFPTGSYPTNMAFDGVGEGVRPLSQKKTKAGMR